MLTSKLQDKLRIFCHASVCHMFAMFHNPRFRGPDFTWEEFPETVRKHCVDTVQNQVKIPTKSIDEAEEFVSETSHTIAEIMIKTMTE